MEDVEILKRLAEIEGVEKKKLPPPYHRQTVYRILDYGVWREWNPLTNWSDLGPLIEKYVQTVEKHADSPNIKEYWRGKYTVLTLDDAGVATHESLPHAICLAIIEANGGMGDE